MSRASKAELRARLKVNNQRLGVALQGLERTGWNQTQAAALLGLNRDQIRYRIEKFHLEKAGTS